MRMLVATVICVAMLAVAGAAVAAQDDPASRPPVRGTCQAPPPKRHTPRTESRTWTCPPGAEVELLTYATGGHDWPAEWNSGIDGTELAWEFFGQHPMPD